MSQKKAKALRKALGMKKENLTTPEYNEVNKVKKIIYFRDKLGQLTPVKSERSQILNTSKHFYRKAKKQLKRG